MSYVDWPEGLNAPVDLSGYTEVFPDTRLKVSMGAGPAKYRQRTSAASYDITYKLALNAAMLTTFRTFYVSTIFGGSMPFNWVHPRSNEPLVFTFKGPPAVSPAGKQQYEVTFTLEVQP